MGLSTAWPTVATLPYFLLSPEPVGHAGEIEASYALALAPELVKPARLTPGHPVGGLPDLAPAVVPWAFHEMTRTGNLGDPTLATAEHGRQQRAHARLPVRDCRDHRRGGAGLPTRLGASALTIYGGVR